jgi:hypothetical protein
LLLALTSLPPVVSSLVDDLEQLGVVACGTDQDFSDDL